MLSAKYVAGFLDADGCVSVKWKKPTQKPLIEVSFAQKTDQDGVLSLIQEQYGGNVEYRHHGPDSHTKLIIRGAKAKKLLGQVKKHLVVKRYYAERCLEVCEEPPGDLKEARKRLKEDRKVRSLPLPNFPPRKWLAGYFDGDGCIYTRLQKHGPVQVQMGIACSPYDTEGIETVQKAFGGNVREMSKGNHVNNLVVGIPPSKAEKVLGYFAKHLLIKRDQAEFILGCAKMGHYRDGRAIHEGLKHLKTCPHRLNDPGADVSEILSKVRDIQWVSKGGCGTECSKCGTVMKPHFKAGFCEDCYLSDRGVA